MKINLSSKNVVCWEVPNIEIDVTIRKILNMTN